MARRMNKLILLILLLGSMTLITASTIENGNETEEKIWDKPIYIGDKIVKELCKPIYKNWTEEIRHYKNCTTNCSIENKSCVPTQYKCIDYIEEIPHLNEQVGCTKTGDVDVSGEIIAYENFWCKLDGTKICCVHNKEGGQYGAFWRTDGSVTKWCWDLITNKETFDNSLYINLRKKIRVVI